MAPSSCGASGRGRASCGDIPAPGSAPLPARTPRRCGVCWSCVFPQPWLCMARPRRCLDAERLAPGAAGSWSRWAVWPCLLPGLPCWPWEGEPETPAWLPGTSSSWEMLAAALGFAGRVALPALASSVVKSQQPVAPQEELAEVSGAKSAKHGRPQAPGPPSHPTPPSARTAAPGLACAPPARRAAQRRSTHRRGAAARLRRAPPAWQGRAAGAGQAGDGVTAAPGPSAAPGAGAGPVQCRGELLAAPGAGGVLPAGRCAWCGWEQAGVQLDEPLPRGSGLEPPAHVRALRVPPCSRGSLLPPSPSGSSASRQGFRELGLAAAVQGVLGPPLPPACLRCPAAGTGRAGGARGLFLRQLDPRCREPAGMGALPRAVGGWPCPPCPCLRCPL